MFRYSTGLRAIEGNDIETKRGYILYLGEKSLSNLSSDLQWRLEEELSGNRRFWILNKPGIFQAFRKPLPESSFEFLQKAFQNIKITEVHPVFCSGIREDAVGLFPGISISEISAFEDFVAFLVSNYGLDLSTNQEMASFSDDFGPCLMGSCDHQPILLPEFPKLYLAPKNWLRCCWIVNNYFSGPYPKRGELVNALKGRRYFWSGLIPSANDHVAMEGIIYFLIGRMILIHEAWLAEEQGSNTNTANLFLDFAEIIQEKRERPWNELF